MVTTTPVSPTSSAPQPWTLPGARPLYATRRNPELYSEGAQVDVVARTLGTPLIPWQRYVADVAGERRPDGSYEHQVIVVSVPRQTGKTTLLRSVGTHRAIAGRDVFYTAQTGKDARARWMDLVKVLRLNPALKNHIKIALRGGSEHVEFEHGGLFQCFAPTPESLHGYTPPLVLIDEAFAQFGDRGDLLMGAISPAQFTITDRQVWIVSTAGTAESMFLHSWIDRAMEGTDRVAGFIWAAREDHNPYDATDIAAFHPGVGFELNGKTLTPTDVLDEVERHTRAEYERAFANRRTQTASHLIPAETWRELAAPAAGPPTSTRDCVLTYDVAVDRQSAAILAAWLDEHDQPRIMVLEHRPGTSWLADAVAQLDRKWHPLATGAVGNGPVLDVTRELRARGCHIDELTEREWATACTGFLTRIDDRALSYVPGENNTGGELLERAVTGLVTRSAGGDGIAFSRRHSVGDASPAIAAVAGIALLARHATNNRTPFIYTKASA